MDKWELKKVMEKNHDTPQDLAEYLKISVTSVYNKINEAGTEFKKKEISAIIEKYSLTDEEIKNIFFN